MKCRILISGAIGDRPHEAGDVIEATPRQVGAWVKAGIAQRLDDTGDEEAG